MIVTVLFSPAARLERTRLCVVAPTPAPVDWPGWCAAMAGRGVGMILVGAAGHVAELDERLGAARQVVGNVLVAVAEPVDPAVRADAVHLTDLGHGAAWSGRLVGCQVWSTRQAEAALVAGCAYLVADWRVPGLVPKMAELQRERPGMVWFTTGCRDAAELAEAASQGAIRAWMRVDQSVAAECSALLRQVWRSDPAMGGLARMGVRP